MSSHHDHDHNETENKPVPFITPLILALVTVLIIVISVNACDRKKECCCEGEKCETKCDDKHASHHGTEATEEHHEGAEVVTPASTVHDTTTSMSLDTAHIHVEADTHTEAHH